ncbi:hypothetical protein B0H10DRAFT_1953675 [Mycena sp. CBHHK59/15]|nr:hypothetical protein B0H10DRAFT_1953675 [Mycena sp. CBHHK59/15]
MGQDTLAPPTRTAWYPSLGPWAENNKKVPGAHIAATSIAATGDGSGHGRHEPRRGAASQHQGRDRDNTPLEAQRPRCTIQNTSTSAEGWAAPDDHMQITCGMSLIPRQLEYETNTSDSGLNRAGLGWHTVEAGYGCMLRCRCTQESTSNFLYATPPHASLCRRRSGRRWPTSTTAIVTASFRLMRTMHRLLKECETGVGNTTLFLHLKVRVRFTLFVPILLSNPTSGLSNRALRDQSLITYPNNSNPHPACAGNLSSSSQIPERSTDSAQHFHLVLVHISEAFTYIQACHMPPARSSAQTILPECPKERYLLYFNPTIAY